MRKYIVLLPLLTAAVCCSAQGSLSTGNPDSLNKFYAAVESGNLGLTCNLLMRGANPNASSDLGQKPIHVAHEVDMVELLVNHGAKVNEVDAYNETALLLAAFDADVERVRFLLKNGANPNIPNNNYYTPILLGLEPEDFPERRTKIAKLLLDNGADPNVGTRFTKTTPLYYAVRARNKEVVSLLLDKGARLNGEQGENGAPLDLLDPRKDVVLYELLAKAGAKHFRLQEELLASLYGENIDKINPILDKGLDLNFFFAEDGLSPLIISVRYLENIQITRLFLNYGADVDLPEPKTLRTPLHSAINYRKPLPFIELLVDQGADIEAVDSEGWTPLMHASALNRIDVVTYFVEIGAEFKTKNKAGKSALDLATEEGHLDVASLLEILED